ncbi:hypothetical protein [uncultured Williamsia sp.]|uniref:hypothetical protein n=1 Tax=uncultured Williamsia sp. TaxID=259311 RepID=UPI002613CA0B|nr:hypothetical protein [uncultured Williamsia sp.]
MSDHPSEAYAEAVIAGHGLSMDAADRARLAGTIAAFRPLAEMLHATPAARYAVPAIALDPRVPTGGDR